MNVGNQAPEFTLPDQNGKKHALADYRGSWVLLYFYPKDDTPGCTTEACTIRDNFSEFQKSGIVVLGVSVDSVESHQQFVAKYALPFTLLSDQDREVVTAYGVYNAAKVRRQSFLINSEGKIAKIYETVKPAEHATEVLRDIRTMT